MSTTSAHLVTVNVVHTVFRGRTRDTAIDKRPVSGLVEAGELGLSGDRQCNRGCHGGRDKAVYAYAEEDADWWGDELGREVPAGLFGENLRTVGLDVTGARIGERWWVGSEDRGVLFEVRMPRTPCRNLSDRMGIDRFHDRFNSSGRVGAMLKVCTPGQVRAGDSIVVERRPQHGITVADLATGPTPEQMELLLHSGVSLATSVRNAARRVIKRAAA